MNVIHHNAVNSRFNSVDARFSRVDARFNSIDARLNNVEVKFDTLTGKVIDVDNCVTRIEAKLASVNLFGIPPERIRPTAVQYSQ